MLGESKEDVIKDLEAVSKDRDESVENNEPKQTRQD